MRKQFQDKCRQNESQEKVIVLLRAEIETLKIANQKEKEKMFEINNINKETEAKLNFTANNLRKTIKTSTEKQILLEEKVRKLESKIKLLNESLTEANSMSSSEVKNINHSTIYKNTGLNEKILDLENNADNLIMNQNEGTYLDTAVMVTYSRAKLI